MEKTSSPKKCVIFDIDGTLVDSSTFESTLYNAAITHVLGEVSIRAEWSEYKHVTDAAIVSEILRENGINEKGHSTKIRKRFGDLVEAHLSAGGECPEIPGARTLFDNLCTAPGLKIGIATGGWAHTAQMKLKYAGFDVSGVPIATSDEHHHRVGIMRHCRSRLPVAPSTVYVGDAVWDLQASEKLGWAFIGVGPALRGKCNWWVADLSELQDSDFL